MKVTDLMHSALVACAQSPDGKLRRTRGGYVATGTKVPVFTKRLINTLNNAWLLQLHGTYREHATLTVKGQKLATTTATQQRPSEQVAA